MNLLGQTCEISLPFAVTQCHNSSEMPIRSMLICFSVLNKPLCRPATNKNCEESQFLKGDVIKSMVLKKQQPKTQRCSIYCNARRAKGKRQGIVIFKKLAPSPKMTLKTMNSFSKWLPIHFLSINSFSFHQFIVAVVHLFYLHLGHDGMSDSLHAHSEQTVCITPLWHHSVLLLLALSARWSAELYNVEIYKCSKEVQESSSRHQHRKQVG